MIIRDEFGLKSDTGGAITEQEYAEYLKYGPGGRPAEKPFVSSASTSSQHSQPSSRSVEWVERLVRLGFVLFDKYQRRKSGVTVRRHKRSGKTVRKHTRDYPDV